MQLPEKTRINEIVSSDPITVSVQRSSRVAPALLDELLTCFVCAVHDAAASGGENSRHYGDRRLVELRGPRGPVLVGLARNRVGGWDPEMKGRFIAALTEHGAAIDGALAQLLQTGTCVASSRIKKWMTYFLGERPVVEQIKFVNGRLRSFLDKHDLSTIWCGAADKLVRCILEFVAEKGLPAQAVEINEFGPQVNLIPLAAIVGVPLRSIEMHGKADALRVQLGEIASGSPWSYGKWRYVPTRNFPFGRETFPGVVVNFKKINVGRGGLLDDILGAYVLPADHQNARLLMRFVEWLVEAPDGKNRDVTKTSSRLILGTPVAKLRDYQAIALLDGLAFRLQNRDLGGRTKKEYLAVLRKALTEAFERHGRLMPRYRIDEGALDGVSGRGLVSDQPDAYATDESLRPSIVNVASGSVDEVRTKAIAHVEDRIGRVEAACDHEIEEYLRWREFLRKAETQVSAKESAQFVSKMIGFGASYSKAYSQWLLDADVTDIAGCMMVAARERQLYRDECYHEMRAKQHSVLLKGAIDRMIEQFPSLAIWCRAGRSTWMGMIPLTAWYVPRWVQLALELKIQTATAWNRGTVHNLLASGVIVRDGELQSLKSKTGKFQYGGGESVDRLLREGLRLMLEHDQNVSANWSRERDGLFVTLVSKRGQHVFGTGTQNKLLQRFIEKHQLPHFTREQLRNQGVAKRYLTNEDPHEIQALLGHGDLATTSGYLHQTVTAVLNRANIADFQRQLAVSIVWACEGKDSVVARGFDPGALQRQLLFSVSDRMDDEAMPPACDVWMVDQKHPLLIDRVRIAHLARQRAYYRAHWQRLRAEAPERFALVHRPRIEFTAALCALVKDSPYAGLLKEEA